MKPAAPLLFMFLTGLTLCHGQPVISTVAGSGTLGYSGDNGPANKAKLSIPTDMATDGSGNLYIVDRGNNVVRKVDSSGTITTFAGNGTADTKGDGGPASKAELAFPVSIAVDKSGNVFIATIGGIRKVDTSGTISTVVTFGAAGLAFDSSGNLLFCDANGTAIHKMTPGGTLTVVAGGAFGFSGDGGPATSAALDFPSGIAVDASGNIFFADKGNNRVRKVDTKGIITTVAGMTSSGFVGDGGQATNAKLGANNTDPFMGVAVDSAGNIYIADPLNNRIRVVNSSGVINTYAGNGNAFLTANGDGTPPASASVLQPNGVRVDSAGNVFIADTNHNLIREVVGGAAASGTGSSGPVITDVENGASFLPGVVANSWVTIKGSNLSPVADNWNTSVVNGVLPTSLDGVSVTMGGQPAYMYYITANQLNVLAPDISPGPVSVVVKTPNGTSTAVTATVAPYGPAFFLWPGNQVVATRQDYSYAVKQGTFAGVNTIAAKPSDVLILWATGFGPTTPLAPDGVEVPATQTYSTSAVTVSINNLPATVYGAALASGSVGLYQIAIQVPPALANGDWPIQATVGGVTSPTGSVLTVQK